MDLAAEPRETILIQVSGPDRTGITAGVLGVLAQADTEVHDIEQTVIRGRITLGLAVTVPGGRQLQKELLLFGWEHDLHVAFEAASPNHTPRQPGHVVTVIGPTLTPRELEAATRSITDGGGNIDRVVRLSRYPVWSYELSISGGDPAKMRENLLAAAAAHPTMDVAIQKEGLGRRAKRLVVMDVDSTLIQDEMIDVLAGLAGVGPEVASITAQAMHGELDFEQALRERVRLLAGLRADRLDEAAARLRLTPGARTFVRTLRRLGFKTALVSGGFTVFTDRLVAELGVDHAYANTLEIVDGHLTGEVTGTIVDRRRKAEILRQVAAEECVSVEQTVAIGDGANDLDMIAAAGLGVAFCAKPALRNAADTSVTVPYLDAILFLLGVSREEVELADAGDVSPPPSSAG